MSAVPRSAANEMLSIAEDWNARAAMLSTLDAMFTEVRREALLKAYSPMFTIPSRLSSPTVPVLNIHTVE